MGHRLDMINLSGILSVCKATSRLIMYTKYVFYPGQECANWAILLIDLFHQNRNIEIY